MTDRERRYHEAVKAVERHGSKAAAAAALGIRREALRDRIGRGPGGGSVETAEDMDSAILRDKIRTLTAQLHAAKAATLTDEMVKREIVKLGDAPVDPPDWMVRPPKRGHVTGVPVLLASDWHWAERVSAAEVNGANSYDLEIAHRRARTLIEVTIDLLKTRFASPSYPGIVFCLGGDLVSGTIHEELNDTNDLKIMPTVVDLFGVLVWCIETLADAFSNVFLPCVSGNHSRTSHKPRSKSRHHTSYEWLLYQFLAKRFESDPRVRFLIPDSPDARFNVYRTRFALVHGDQFKTSDSVIGPLGPVIRGNLKKAARNAALNSPHDVLLLGHFHRLAMLQDIIMNGSLVGVSEYSWQGNFGYEPPRQALFLVHPNFVGPTFSMPVNVEREVAVQPTSWVSWTEGKPEAKGARR